MDHTTLKVVVSQIFWNIYVVWFVLSWNSKLLYIFWYIINIYIYGLVVQVKDFINRKYLYIVPTTNSLFGYLSTGFYAYPLVTTVMVEVKGSNIGCSVSHLYTLISYPFELSKIIQKLFKLSEITWLTLLFFSMRKMNWLHRKSGLNICIRLSKCFVSFEY